MAESLRQQKRLVSPLYQVVLIIISMTVISMIIFESLKKQHIVDPKATFFPILPQEYKEFGSDAVKVESGLYINQFQEFDIIKNNFLVSGMVWFLVNVGDVSLETLGKFSFNEGQIVQKSDPYIKLIHDRMFVVYHVVLKFRSDFDYRNFPIDDHQIHLMLQNQFVSPSDLLLVSSQNNFNLSNNIATVGWSLVNKLVHTGYNKNVLNPYRPKTTLEYPIALFILNFVRDNVRYIMSILLPLLFIFYLALFSFSLEERAAISLATGGITAILAYRFIIENIAPQVSYFMISDYIFFLMLVSSCFIFLVNSIDMFARPISLMKKNIIVALLHGVIIMSLGYLLLVH